MQRRVVAAAMLALLLIAFSSFAPSSAASSANAADNVPADFAGFIRLRMDQPGAALLGLNVGLFTASFLQPDRITYTQATSLDTFLPLDLLDVEDASFTKDILPWLGSEVVLAYKHFDSKLQAGLPDGLMILPTTNVFASATSLHRIIQGQDFPKQDTYQGVTLYIGDKSTIAITPDMVFIGAEDLVREALDVQAGAAPRMTDSAAYSAIEPSTSSDTLIFAFANGSESLSALNFALGGKQDSSLLAAMGQALLTLHPMGTLESMLLGGQVDGLGLTVQPDINTLGKVDATVTLFKADPPNNGQRLTFDAHVLDMIPRNVMAVVSGPNGQEFAYEALAALPLANFAGRILGGFPVPESAGSASGQVAAPTAADILTSVRTFLAALKETTNLDLENDVFSHLNGSYSIALLPRPNDPNALFGTPYDILILAQVDDGSAALAGVKNLFETYYGTTAFTDETVQGETFSTLSHPQTDEPLLRLGVVDHMLVIASGTAADFAMDARRGDNRLTNQARWKALDSRGSGETVPYVYVDVRSLRNIILPIAGGSDGPGVNQLGISVSSPADGVFQLHLLVTLRPQ